MRHQRARPLGRRLGTRRLRRQEGVESLEVALIGALLVVSLLLGVPILTDGIGDAFNSVTTALQNAGEGLP
jgi:Flp pilus assembly pilin Flp